MRTAKGSMTWRSMSSSPNGSHETIILDQQWHAFIAAGEHIIA